MAEPNLKTCAVTGQAYEAGDYVIKGQYIVKASVNYTPELRAETEARLGIAPAYVITPAPLPEIVRGKRGGVDLQALEAERHDDA